MKEMGTMEGCRKDFPILGEKVYGRPLVYLDNAATTQAPRQVLDAVRAHYEHEHANVHRGIHYLSERATQKMEEARGAVAAFIGAHSSSEVIFTRGTTDAINIVADGIQPDVGEGDEIAVSVLEHHSNFVPWQQLCKRKNARLRVIPAPDGEIDMQAYRGMLNERTKLVAVTQVSNLTGTVTPLAGIISLAHEKGIPVLVDGAQGVRHAGTDVSALDCDFYCFSGHKMLATTGIGVLYGKREQLERLMPSRFGGGMVDVVTVGKTTFAPLPARLEAGTPDFAGTVALCAAVSYIQQLGREEIGRRESGLLAYAEHKLGQIEGLHILGQPVKREGVLSFWMQGVHSYDMASMLDKLGIAVRSGSHCAQVALQSFGLTEVTRVSPAFYNTEAEIDTLCAGIEKSAAMLRKWGGRL